MNKKGVLGMQGAISLILGKKLLFLREWMGQTVSRFNLLKYFGVFY